MKKQFGYFAWSVAICTLGLFSCSEKDIISLPVEEGDVPIVVDYDAIKPTNFITVPAKDGFITVVTQGSKTLLATREETTLEVLNPQYSIFTRDSGKDIVDFSYLPDDGSWNEADKYEGHEMYKTIMFEDLVDKSDYDYNDLIIHVQQYKVGNKLRIYIHPIALGGHDRIALGADIFLIDGSTKLGERCASTIFTWDARKELFRNSKLNYDAPEKTFINTSQENTYAGNGSLAEYPIYFVHPVSFDSQGAGAKWKSGSQWIEVNKGAIHKKTFGINWFIINMDKDPKTKLYAVPAIADNIKWRDDLGYPYGIISAYTRIDNWPLTDKDEAGHDWINYAKERVHLKSVYPDFVKWLEGTKNANWDTPAEEFSINAIGYIKGSLGLPNGSKALYDVEGCFRSLGYSTNSMNIWNNGKPVHKNIPIPDGRTNAW